MKSTMLVCGRASTFAILGTMGRVLVGRSAGLW